MNAPTYSPAAVHLDVQAVAAGTSGHESLRGFVHECAALFVDPVLATTIANQVAANYEHWRRHGTLCVLLEGADTGEVTVDGVDWAPVGDTGDGWEAVVSRQVAMVSRRPNGEWGWARRSNADLDGDSGDDDSGYDTYATPEDAMRAALWPEDASEDRWYRSSARHSLTHAGRSLSWKPA